MDDPGLQNFVPFQNMYKFCRSDDHRMCRAVFTKIRHILANEPYAGNGEFYVIVLYMEVTLVHDNYYARNIISLTSKARLGSRLN